MQALTLWLAILPALTIPFLQGGVGWHEVVFSVLINFSSLCCALAGILASSYSRAWWRALLLALAIAVVMFALFLWLKGDAIFWLMRSQLPKAYGNFQPAMSTSVFFQVAVFAGDMNNYWAQTQRVLPRAGVNWWMLLEAAQALAAVLFLALAIELAAAMVRRNWQDRPASRLQIWWGAVFCRPVIWVAFFHRWLGRKLQRNPIGAAEQRTWSGRLARWGWLALIIGVYSAMLADMGAFGRDDLAERLMAWLLLGNLALSAAGSFRRERENGVLELLLISPLDESQIVGGRLRGLWAQFLPAWAVLMGVWLYFQTVFGDSVTTFPSEHFLSVCFFFVSFATVPIVGLYFSLRPGNFASAVFFTLLVAIILPVILSYLLVYVFTADATPLSQAFCVAFCKSSRRSRWAAASSGVIWSRAILRFEEKIYAKGFQGIAPRNIASRTAQRAIPTKSFTAPRRRGFPGWRGA